MYLIDLYLKNNCQKTHRYFLKSLTFSQKWCIICI
nr:MAG TPA: hypothetical protein [Caudoviricetes sp.]